MDCPLDYSLCDQTVTLYRSNGNAVTRQVVEGAFYRWQDRGADYKWGASPRRSFLLILPGDVDIAPGDRVIDGIGPEQVSWLSFTPATVDTLSEVDYVTTHYWEGRVCHREAGRKAND